MSAGVNGLKRQTRKQESLVRLPVKTYIFILNICLLPVPRSSVKSTQTKLSMSFVQSNRCIEIDLTFKNIAAVYMMYRKKL